MLHGKIGKSDMVSTHQTFMLMLDEHWPGIARLVFVGWSFCLQDQDKEPGKHETFIQLCVNAGQASQTVVQQVHVFSQRLFWKLFGAMNSIYRYIISR